MRAKCSRRNDSDPLKKACKSAVCACCFGQNREVERPATQYARVDGLSIAYQTFGKGPNLLVSPGWISNVDGYWTLPECARFASELAQSFRVTMFDKRGTGLSDRDVGYPTLDDRMEDMRAVLDDAGIAKTAILGVSEGGSMAILFAATYPERVTHLALFGCFACREWKQDYPWAPTPEERQKFYEDIERNWGNMDVSYLNPSLKSDPAANERWNRYMRSGASPRSALRMGQLNTTIDIRHVLPTLRIPALIMHRENDRDVKIAEARYLANAIPEAHLVELKGDDHFITVGDSAPVIELVRELVGVERPVSDHRMLSTVLFTDIVDSTGQLQRLGDEEWRKRLEAHFEMIEGQVRAFRGRLVKLTGDGALAHFDGPSRAAKCALSIIDLAEAQGIAVRAAVHSCEIELMGSDITGLGVHLTARAMACAGSGEVVATETVKALTSGSGLQFEPMGDQSFKGFSEPVAVFRVR